MEEKILEKKDYEKWMKFLDHHPLSSIHQIPQWGEFQQATPTRGKFWIVALEKNEKIIAGTMIIRHKLPKGYCWFYAARGPLLDFDNPKIAQKQMNALLDHIKEIARREHAVFLRIDPALTPEKPIIFKGFQKTNKGFQPNHTLIIDLSKSEAEILSEMKQKGRYNIKLAEKKGVKIRISDPANTAQLTKDIDAFYKLLSETTSRDKFHGHNKEFYKNMVQILGKNHAKLYVAEYKNDIIAATIVTHFKDTAIYYYGVSGNQHRNVMAPYLLQWQAIKDAKEAGLKHYDFLGISPPNQPRHAWAGVTDFKSKFGGQEVSYQLPQEYSFKKLHHSFYKLYKKLR